MCWAQVAGDRAAATHEEKKGGGDHWGPTDPPHRRQGGPTTHAWFNSRRRASPRRHGGTRGRPPSQVARPGGPGAGWGTPACRVGTDRCALPFSRTGAGGACTRPVHYGWQGPNSRSGELPERGAAGHGASPRPAVNDVGGQASVCGRGPGVADGLTEKGTHEVQPGRPKSRRRGGGGIEAAVGWGCRAPSRGALGRSKRVATASRPPGHATGSHRHRPPTEGRSHGTQDADWPPWPPGEPLRVSRPQPPTSKVAAGAGECSPYAYLRPYAPHAQPGVPSVPRGRHRGRRPGDNIQVRRGRFGPRQGRGHGRLPVRTEQGPAETGRGGRHSQPGPWLRGTGPVQGTERPRHGRTTRKTRARSHCHTHKGASVTSGTPAGLRYRGASRDRLRRRGRLTCCLGAPSTQIIRPSSADPSSSSPTHDSRPRDQFSSEAAQPVPAHQQRLWLLAKAGLRGS